MPAVAGGPAAAPALVVLSPPAAAPRRAGSAPGRKPSDVKAEFDAVLGEGAKCKHCDKLVKNKQQNGTLLALHLYSCRPVPLLVKQMAWSSCATLQRSKPRPFDPHASVLPRGGETPSRIGQAAAGTPSGSAPTRNAAPSVLSYMDRVSAEQAEGIASGILNFFVSCRVPFALAEHPAFIELLKALRPAYVLRKLPPTPKQLAGPLLDRLYEQIRACVLRSLSEWCTRRKAVLILDAWENVNHHHIVNLLATIGGKPVFLDSVYFEDACQDAAGQAQLVQDKLAAYGGRKVFNAVGSDNTASCLEMRRLVTSLNPGMVSLNDQAHVANLLIGDLCKVPWLKDCISGATAVSSYLRHHQRLLAAYTREQDIYNKTLDSQAAAEKRTAVAYKSPSTTRFLYNRDLLLTCARNRPALRNLLERDNGSELPRLVKTRDQAARDAQATFLRAAESTAVARDWATACRVLDPVCAYLRLFDGERSRLSLVLPATRRVQADMTAMESALRSDGMAGTASPAVFAQLCAAVKKRVSGPSDRSVRVLLLADIHYLAAVLDPKVFDAHADDVANQVERAFRAIRTYFVSSPDVFSAAQLVQLSEDERMLVLREQLTTYTALSGSFQGGTFAARVPGVLVDIEGVMASQWDLWGWWAVYGGSSPQLREIGKALAGMTPSSCPVERSFSLQGSIHSLVRNRLTHDKVAKLMFVYTNMKLVSGTDLSAEQLDFFMSVAGETGNGREREGDSEGRD